MFVLGPKEKRNYFGGLLNAGGKTKLNPQTFLFPPPLEWSHSSQPPPLPVVLSLRPYQSPLRAAGSSPLLCFPRSLLPDQLKATDWRSEQQSRPTQGLDPAHWRRSRDHTQAPPTRSRKRRRHGAGEKKTIEEECLQG